MHRRFSQSILLGVIVFATSMAVLAQTSGRPAPNTSPSAGVDPSADNPRGKFVRVAPLPPNSSGASSGGPPIPNSGGDLRIGQGKFFSFALPQGWRAGEDGQYALTLVAPDDKALTIMVGVAGMPVNSPPARFAYEKLSALRMQNLQLGGGRQARPVTGFAQAVEFDVSYMFTGVAQRGLAKVSGAPAYDTATMAMTAALSSASQWGGYGSWLPQVADQVPHSMALLSVPVG